MRPALLDDHAAIGLLDGLEDGVEIQRAERPRVDHLGLGAVLVRERLCGALGDVDHPQEPDDRDVAALAQDRSLTEVDERPVAVAIGVGDLAASAVERLVLDEDHRVVVADRRLQKALAVGRRGRAGDEQAGDVQEHRLEAVGVSWAQLVAAAARHPNHDWDAHLAIEHVRDRRHVVDDLVHREQREVHGHDLHDRPQPRHRGAHSGADDRVL